MAPETEVLDNDFSFEERWDGQRAVLRADAAKAAPDLKQNYPKFQEGMTGCMEIVKVALNPKHYFLHSTVSTKLLRAAI